MRFKTWLENLEMLAAQNAAPASSEVIKTGLQPQVDAKEISTKQKEDHDKIMALDTHFERIKSSIDGMNNSQNQKKIKDFCTKVCTDWEKIKMGESPQQDVDGFKTSQKQVDYMKNNQPLPEMPREYDYLGGTLGGVN